MTIARADLLEEMHLAVREAAGLAVAGESVKAAINRAARSLGISEVRARKHWYRIAASVPGEELEQIRQAKARVLRERRARLNHELQLLEAELSALEGTGAPMDSDEDAGPRPTARPMVHREREGLAGPARALAVMVSAQ